MQKEKKTAVKNAILIAAAQKMLDLNFSIDYEELPDKASNLFENFMLTEYGNDIQERQSAYEVLTALRDLCDLVCRTNLELAQSV